MGTLKTKDGGTWKDVKVPYLKSGGAWVQPKAAFVKYGGTWEKFYNQVSCHGAGLATPVGNYSHSNPTTVNGITVTFSRQYTPWAAYGADVFDNIGGNWWTGATGEDGAYESVKFDWGNYRWVSHITIQPPNNTYYKATPHKFEVWVKYGSTGAAYSYLKNVDVGHYSSWTNVKTISINAQHPDGIYGVKLVFFNNRSYKEASQSARIGELRLYTGGMTIY